MNTTQHTPGPWYLDAHDEKGWFLLSESGPDIMAEPFDCADADARLIATAPDLLSALEALHACHRAFSANENWTMLDDEARAMAEAAIAKAKGGAA
jgi:hypothetical protein